MHADAQRWVANFATDEPITTGIDREAGPMVDQVTDAIHYTPEMPADLVVCCEVLEHAENWRQIIRRSRQWLKPGGALIVTSAGLGRKPHSCDGGQLREGEYYRNLDPSDLRAELIAARYRWRYVRQWQTDLQSFAVR
jgi:trans-aconitate methyltransferase